MATSICLAPVPLRPIVVSSGTVYTPDQYGIIVNVQTAQDQADLVSAGCAVLVPQPSDLLFKMLAADFNSTGDQLLTPNFIGKYRVRRITALNTTVNGMSTAAGGFYTAASKGGSAIVAAGQLYTGLTNAATALDLTLALPNLVNASGTPLYFSLTTPQGTLAKADIFVYGDVCQ